MLNEIKRMQQLAGIKPLNELEINKPAFNENWIKQNIKEIVKILNNKLSKITNTIYDNNIEVYLDINEPFNITRVDSSDTEEWQFHGYMVNNIDNDYGLYITNNISEKEQPGNDYNDYKNREIGTGLLLMNISGINVLAGGIGV